MTLQSRCAQLDASLAALIQRSTLQEHPDTRAFGAYAEKTVKDNWLGLCRQWGVEAEPHPGARSIFDASFRANGFRLGIDIKSKNLGSNRYADGGVCSVGNLVPFLLHGNILVLCELGYWVTARSVDFEYLTTAPIHVLPIDMLRIENLGTGQVRLESSLRDAELYWDRAPQDFLALFAPLCLAHYSRVARVAYSRAQAIERFIESGYRSLSLNASSLSEGQSE